MVYVNNIKEQDFQKKVKQPHNMWLARFFETTIDGIVSCWEHPVDHEPTTEDFAQLEALCISMNKEWKKVVIRAYDVSDAVNGFLLNGQHAWLLKNDRTALRARFMSEKEDGVTTTTLWYGEQSFTLSVDDALNMLRALERYASQCYDKTAEHLAAVSALTTIADINAYDYTAGYPAQLSFTI